MEPLISTYPAFIAGLLLTSFISIVAFLGYRLLLLLTDASRNNCLSCVGLGILSVLFIWTSRNLAPYYDLSFPPLFVVGIITLAAILLGALFHLQYAEV